MAPKTLIFFALFSLLAIVALADTESTESDSGLMLNFYKDTCPQAEDIIREQVGLLYKRHKNTAFSWLRNIFHDCAVESCDASLLLDSTRRSLSEKETDRSFGLRNFRYLETIKEALERECPGVVSCADILVLSGRDGIVSVNSVFYSFLESQENKS
ncbi:putative peroxidase [Helianthus annuus]|nr:putative peroxidase [Helianthus annuus]KAJ0651560.1 putative peroxidase [Helianthus annuus]